MNSPLNENQSDRSALSNQPDAVAAFCKRFVIVYYAMIAAMAMVYVVFSFGLPPQQDRIVFASYPNIFIIVLAVNFTAILVGAIIYRIKLRSAANESTAERKIAHYQIGYLIRLALLEATAIINMIAYYIIGESKLQILFGGILLLFVVTGYPNVSRVKKEIGSAATL